MKEKSELLKKYYAEEFTSKASDDFGYPKKFEELSEGDLKALSESVGFAGWQIEMHKRNILAALARVLPISKFKNWINRKS